MNFAEVRKTQLAKIHSPHLHVGVPGSFKVYSDAKERVGYVKERETTAPIQSLVKLQPWFLSFEWKTCLQQNCSLGFLLLQWRICPWAEHWWLNYRPNWKNQLISVPFWASENMVTLPKAQQQRFHLSTFSRLTDLLEFTCCSLITMPPCSHKHEAAQNHKLLHDELSRTTE